MSPKQVEIKDPYVRQLAQLAYQLADSIGGAAAEAVKLNALDCAEQINGYISALHECRNHIMELEKTKSVR